MILYLLGQSNRRRQVQPDVTVVVKGTLGSFNIYVDRILPFFEPTLRGQFLYHEQGQKQTSFDHFPPHPFHVVIEWPFWYKGEDSNSLQQSNCHFWSLSHLINFNSPKQWKPFQKIWAFYQQLIPSWWWYWQIRDNRWSYLKRRWIRERSLMTSDIRVRWPPKSDVIIE